MGQNYYYSNNYLENGSFEIQYINHGTEEEPDIEVFPPWLLPDDETLVSSVFCHSECDEINIGIYSLTGQLLLSKDYQLKSGNNVLSLNLENLTTGTYLIRFKSNGTMRNTGKFILLK